jgi:hypothetical protein
VVEGYKVLKVLRVPEPLRNRGRDKLRKPAEPTFSRSISNDADMRKLSGASEFGIHY